MSESENVVSIAISAATKLLDRMDDESIQLSMIACSSTTPKEATPSIACQVATALADRLRPTETFLAFDFNAACSGFLYGLQLAGEHLLANPKSAVLLLTSEGISPGINRMDPSTCYIFGDAATATIIGSVPRNARSLAIRRRLCFSLPDPSVSIWGPCFGAPGHLRMDGIAVARTAYKAMAKILRETADRERIDLAQLFAILPHPGSKRILMNLAEFLGLELDRVWHTLADTGNPSSSSIPLAIDRFWDRLEEGKLLVFAAFGSGFTSAAAIGQMNGDRTT